MADDYLVKGSSIRSKFEFVRERFGRAAERELREEFEPQAGAMPFLDSSMYPFEIYDEINRAIAARFYDGDLERLREVGEFSARKVLTGVYRAFAAGRDFPRFLERAAVLHERFYRPGRMLVELGDDEASARVRLTDAPVYSEADLHIAAGFYLGAARLLGLENAFCDFHLKPDGAHFDLSWADSK